jgi:hypothetical protein
MGQGIGPSAFLDLESDRGRQPRAVSKADGALGLGVRLLHSPPWKRRGCRFSATVCYTVAPSGAGSSTLPASSTAGSPRRQGARLQSESTRVRFSLRPPRTQGVNGCTTACQAEGAGPTPAGCSLFMETPRGFPNLPAMVRVGQSPSLPTRLCLCPSGQDSAFQAEDAGSTPARHSAREA